MSHNPHEGLIRYLVILSSTAKSTAKLLRGAVFIPSLAHVDTILCRHPQPVKLRAKSNIKRLFASGKSA